ncbi:MAG: hypothetical protein KDC53_03270 [Saprospiraceae bacterium]|nr:hypothetical protein [Saprospiraceae bacterium]
MEELTLSATKIFIVKVDNVIINGEIDRYNFLLQDLIKNQSIDGVVKSFVMEFHFMDDRSPRYRLRSGSEYLIFVKENGEIVGGLYQGILELIKDEANTTYYLRDLNGRLRVLANGEVTTSANRVDKVLNGKMLIKDDDNGLNFNNKQSSRLEVAPKALDSLPIFEKIEKEDIPVSINIFLEKIKKTMSVQDNQPRFSPGYYEKDDSGHTQWHPNPILDSYRSKLEDFSISEYDASETNSFGQLGACGAQILNIVFQQVPESWWSWQLNNDAMFHWNQFMDIYRYIDSDGTWSDGNGTNEFGGFPTNYSSYCEGLACCITYSGGNCTQITETDIILDGDLSWTSDFNFAFQNYSVYSYMPIIMHELGHSWGYIQGTYQETYDYPNLSVMHAYYSGIVEDGKGIHSSDAYLIRRHYDDQKSIPTFWDIGVESYYAPGGNLRNSTLSSSSRTPGESFAVENFTVENMSNNQVNNLYVRFYLSNNSYISTSDIPVGTYYWNSFNAESYYTGDFNLAIPNNQYIQAGEYYVGAIVSRNVDQGDDYASNNQTFLAEKLNITHKLQDICELASYLAIQENCVSTFVNLDQRNSPSGIIPEFSCYSDDVYVDAWFYTSVPLSGQVNIETTPANNGLSDLVIQIYEGSCSSLTPIKCDDDSSPLGTHAYVALTNQEPGKILYIRVVDYNSDELGEFGICAYQSCPPNYEGNNSLTDSIMVDQMIQSNGIIESEQVIFGQSTSLYISNTEINLLPNFEISNGTIFEALIDTCGN